VNLMPDRIVFVLDLFDVVWLGCRRDIAQAFHKFGRPLVFGAEFSPYPFTNASFRRLSGGYPRLLGRHHATGFPYRVRRMLRIHGERLALWQYQYLNSGCMVGYAGALLRACERVLASDYDNEYVLRTPHANSDERAAMLVGRDDQIAWHTYALKHRDEVALDYGADIFLNTFGFDFPDFHLNEGEVWARPFDRSVCFAHGNGASNLAAHLWEAQLHGVQPFNCRGKVGGSGGVQVHYLACVPTSMHDT